LFLFFLHFFCFFCFVCALCLRILVLLFGNGVVIFRVDAIASCWCCCFVLLLPLHLGVIPS
jgi:hypothetical protein